MTVPGGERRRPEHGGHLGRTGTGGSEPTGTCRPQVREGALGAHDVWWPGLLSRFGAQPHHCTKQGLLFASPLCGRGGPGSGQTTLAVSSWGPRGNRRDGQGRYEVSSPGGQRVWAPRTGRPVSTHHLLCGTHSLAESRSHGPADRAPHLRPSPCPGLLLGCPLTVHTASLPPSLQRTASVLVRDAEKGQKTLQPHCRPPASLC